MNLISILKKNNNISQLTNKDWESLISQAKVSGLLGRLYYLFKTKHLIKHIPDNIIWHFEADYTVSMHIKTNCLREFEDISAGLQPHNIKPILLKGAMYAMANLSASFGRKFSDIDVLVAKSEINSAEDSLFSRGWLPQKKMEYDEKYYRKWMHEIPPLQHAARRTILDLHHNIIPLTNKDHIPFELYEVIEQDINKKFTLHRLSNTDLIIHSAVHLFTESEFNYPLRDLSDIDLLIKEFSITEADFVQKLWFRAEQLNLQKYLRLALKFSHNILETPLGDFDKKQLKAKNKFADSFENFCFITIFKPNHSSCRTWRTPIATFLLYWRGHLIRMPLRLLIPHLARKSWMSIRDAFTKEKKPNENMIP